MRSVNKFIALVRPNKAGMAALEPASDLSAPSRFQQISPITLVGLFLFYMCAGLFYHDPWKTEDAMHIGVVLDMLNEGHWLNPELAGRPWSESPLYYWLAALTAKLCSGLLPLHSGIRASNIIWLSLTLVALYGAARAYFGRAYATIAPLLLIGSIGLIIDTHLAQPALALLALSATMPAATAGLLRHPKRLLLYWFLLVPLTVFAGGWLYVLPIIGFCLFLAASPLWASESSAPFYLAAGELAPSPTLRLPLPNKFAEFENLPAIKRRLQWCLPAALAGILGCILLLYFADSHEYLTAWRQQQRLFVAQSVQSIHFWLDPIVRLPWFAWPAFPLVIWSLWRYRHQWREAAYAHPLALFVLNFIFLSVVIPENDKDLTMTLLPSLVLIATPATLNIRKDAVNALDWFSKILFCLAFCVVWLGWSAMTLAWPEFMAVRFSRFASNFVGTFTWGPVLFATALTGFWLWLIFNLQRSPYRAIVLWCCGFTTLWCCIVTLWLPWIDYGKSYRQMTLSMAAQINKTLLAKQTSKPNEPNISGQGGQSSAQQGISSAECVAEKSVGDAQRASFAYFIGLRLEPWTDDIKCSWLLVQGTSKSELIAPDGRWKKIWEGNRANDRRERFRLYRLAQNK